MDINECRLEIDKINDQMLKLFVHRMQLSEQVAKYKLENGLPILNSAREREILGEMTGKAGPEFENYVKTFYSVIMDLSRSYQSTVIEKCSAVTKKVTAALNNSPKVFPKRAVVACQGTEGAYSQIAADKFFGMQKIQYFKTFEDVFVAVRDKICEYGVLPIENSTYGTVIEVYDLMRKYKFNIARALKLRIKHSLLARPGATLDGIREVYSHPQAIGQCSDFFRANPDIKPIECANTAVAAELVKKSSRLDIAAIASPSCAELYGLSKLSDEVQNASNNYTRFICITGNDYIFPGANKMSLMLTLPHTPGALYTLLTKFTSEGLNLTKLESRPIAGSDFEAQFYFDFEGTPYDSRVLTMLDAISEQCEHFEFLGSYLEI